VACRPAWPTSPCCSRPTSIRTSACATLTLRRTTPAGRQPRRRPAHSGQLASGAAGGKSPARRRRQPYLAIAASLAAGLHGIEQQIAPTPAIQGEFEVPEHLSLPCTLHAALQRLKHSALARELFGSEFIEGYIATKTLELSDFLDEITPWERRVLAAQA
jgi:hypothetical protein